MKSKLAWAPWDLHSTQALLLKVAVLLLVLSFRRLEEGECHRAERRGMTCWKKRSPEWRCGCVLESAQPWILQITLPKALSKRIPTVLLDSLMLLDAAPLWSCQKPAASW